MLFIPFVEENEHEGESWTFWLQYNGNETELIGLAEQLHEDRFEVEPAYSLDLSDVEDEEVVERMCLRARMGYNPSDMMVRGKFTCPDIPPTTEALDDLFYKGRITDHFKG